MVLVCAIWGSTFALVKDTLGTFGAFFINGSRFFIAALLVALFFLASKRQLKAIDLKRGMLLGVFLFIGYATQTVGLQFTSATNSAFITGLLVIMVPICAAFLFKSAPQRKIWLAVLVAIAGLWFLTGAGVGANIGDAITLLTALGFSLHIIYTGKFAKSSDTFALLLGQFGVAAMLSLPFVLALGQVPAAYPIGAATAIVFLALFASLFAEWAQTEAQSRIDANRIALIFLLEPVFAALFGFLLLSEQFTFAKALGAALILLAMFIAESKMVKI